MSYKRLVGAPRGSGHGAAGVSTTPRRCMCQRSDNSGLSSTVIKAVRDERSAAWRCPSCGQIVATDEEAVRGDPVPLLERELAWKYTTTTNGTG